MFGDVIPDVIPICLCLLFGYVVGRRKEKPLVLGFVALAFIALQATYGW